MSDRYHPELGFDLGWDFARYGRFLDPRSANAEVLAGYSAGKAHFQVAQHKPPRYQAKWLQLRLSAMRRCRIVHADVTPEYLEQIDCDRCVVTLESMSHSARAETDWSVDRINNDGAYAAGNLMVISTRAKGAKTYAEVVNFGAGDCNVDRERLELCPMGAPRLRDGWLRRNSRHACDSYAASQAHSGG